MAKIACDSHYFHRKSCQRVDLPQTSIEFAVKEAFDVC